MALTNVIPGSKVPFEIEVKDIPGGVKLSSSNVVVQATFYVMNKMDKGTVVVKPTQMEAVEGNEDAVSALVDTTSLPAGTIMANVEISTKDSSVKWILNCSTGFTLVSAK